jgi:hypothetical protein
LGNCLILECRPTLQLRTLIQPRSSPRFFFVCRCFHEREPKIERSLRYRDVKLVTLHKSPFSSSFPLQPSLSAVRKHVLLPLPHPSLPGALCTHRPQVGSLAVSLPAPGPPQYINCPQKRGPQSVRALRRRHPRLRRHPPLPGGALELPRHRRGRPQQGPADRLTELVARRNDVVDRRSELSARWRDLGANRRVFEAAATASWAGAMATWTAVTRPWNASTKLQPGSTRPRTVSKRPYSALTAL